MYSMTGYGKAEYKEGGLEITVEMKTVNNRFLDINAKYPRIFASLEDGIRKVIRSKLSRGHVDLFVTYSDKRERSVKLDVDISLLHAYIDAAKIILNECDVENDLTLTSLMRMPDVVKETGEQSTEETEKIILGLVERACDDLNKMRGAEGEKLREDLLLHIAEIEKIVGGIKTRAPNVRTEYGEKLRSRIEEYLAGVPVDEEKILNETAIFADKCSIDEEIERLYSHIAQFKDIIGGEAVGRKLDFLVQEFNREANTICSKANDVIITSYGLELKCEIEKIREQIQNLE